jgi:hypothetical protein
MPTPTYSTVIDQINGFIVTNGNNEITANVLNPILKIITDFANNTIGDLATLTTDESDNIVNALNSLKDNINLISNGGVKLFTGFDNPNSVPPPAFDFADFYMQLSNLDNSPIELWQWNGFTWTSGTIDVENYVKKSSYAPFVFLGSGTNAIIPLDPNGYSEIRLQNPLLESIAGYDLSLINGDSSAEIPYKGKPYIIRNLTGNDIVIKNELPAADNGFFLSGEADLIFPANCAIYVSYDVAGFDELFKGWSSGGGGIIENSLSEFQTLITNSQLQIGTTYRINGIDGNFCDGFFTALTPNTFDPNGSGLFRNPNYSLYQLWTNQFYNGVSISVGVPSLNDVFTNGTQSFIWKNTELYIANQDSLPNGTYTSGSKSVTVNGADVWTYDVNDIVIFGNRHWKNVNGNLGAKVDELNLNAEWIEVFDNVKYVVDLITYDIENDWISERKDSKGNEISLSKSGSFNYVKTFNWGKQSSINNKITNWLGVVCNLNFYILNNTLSNFRVSNNTGNYFNISYNTGSNFDVYNNNGNGFQVYNNTGNNFRVYNNNGNNFNVSNNTGSNFDISNNMGSNFYVSSNTGSNFQVYNNNGSNFNVSNNTGYGFNVSSNNGNILNVYNNTGNGFYIYEKSLTSKTIQYCDFKNVVIDDTVDISASTILFESYGKSIFRNSANQIIITYYNENNVLVVSNITD